MVTTRIPKIIPPKSRVRLLRADHRAPTWQKEVGRQFRVGYYNRKDGLDCVWLVNEGGEYEQSTDRRFLAKYFEVEYLSKEKNLYGRGKRRLRKIHVPTAFERLNGRSTIEAYEGAKGILQRGDARAVHSVIKVLLHGRRPFNRAAAAHALDFAHSKAAVKALERVVGDKQENSTVRGQAAESLAHYHLPESHEILLGNLEDPSKEVRFWCAFALAQMADKNALTPLKRLAQTDDRVVRGFWSVSKEARWAIREIRKRMARRTGRRKLCLYCAMEATAT